eukprot:scaffold34224_cov20-Tisochrysis_lutea.AAC.1
MSEQEGSCLQYALVIDGKALSYALSDKLAPTFLKAGVLLPSALPHLSSAAGCAVKSREAKLLHIHRLLLADICLSVCMPLFMATHRLSSLQQYMSKPHSTFIFAATSTGRSSVPGRRVLPRVPLTK